MIRISHRELRVSIEISCRPSLQAYPKQWLLIHETTNPRISTEKIVGIGMVVAFKRCIEIPREIDSLALNLSRLIQRFVHIIIYCGT